MHFIDLRRGDNDKVPHAGPLRQEVSAMFFSFQFPSSLLFMNNLPAILDEC